MCIVTFTSKMEQGICKLNRESQKSSILYEDNIVCIGQIQVGYIKGYEMKHISHNSFSHTSCNSSMKSKFEISHRGEPMVL